MKPFIPFGEAILQKFLFFRLFTFSSCKNFTGRKSEKRLAPERPSAPFFIQANIPRCLKLSGGTSGRVPLLTFCYPRTFYGGGGGVPFKTVRRDVWEGPVAQFSRSPCFPRGRGGEGVFKRIGDAFLF